MDFSLVASLREGVSVFSDNYGQSAVCGSGVQVVFRRLTSAVQEALARLVSPGDSLGRLAAQVQNSHGPHAVAHLFFCLRQLGARGFLFFSAGTGEQRWASLVPTASSFELVGRPMGDQAYVLSRFACIRRLGSQAVLESPLSAAQVILHDDRAALLACVLAAPATVEQVAERAFGLPQEAVRQIMSLFVAAGMIAQANERGASSEDEKADLEGWEFHDLLFHARCREGRHNGVFGNSYPLAGQRQPLPAVKAIPAGEAIELYRPELDNLKTEDPPLAKVMEERRSIRQYATEPISARQLGEFLYRVARVREVCPVDLDTPRGRFRVELSSRPYPTGGALFELEVYPVVERCDGLDPGLYHYDPLRHRLGPICGQTAEVVQLLDRAADAIRTSRQHLQVLLVLTSRFDRVFWKYSSLGYSLILKDVGVVFQNMYLAATAMGLAPCALGCGDSDVFSKAIGSDYYAETSVGEFTLGSKPAQEATGSFWDMARSASFGRSDT